MTITQMSTIDGSPKLERQVQKITMQMSNQCPSLKAAGYFNVGRNMILKVFFLEKCIRHQVQAFLISRLYLSMHRM